MPVQVFHLDKRKTISGGLNRHITRLQWTETDDHNMALTTWVPANADPSRTSDNVELVSREFKDDDGHIRTLSLQQAVDKRIKEAGVRKPKPDQNTSLEIIFSGSHGRMTEMSRSELLNWANDTLRWSQKTWGKDNVVSASLHVDETTPHIHMIVVPIVCGESRKTKYNKKNAAKRGKKRRAYNIDHTKLRLCMNEVYTTELLYKYHDNYAAEVSNKYGLERGLRAEKGSSKSHSGSIDYNRQLEREIAERRALLAEITADYDERSSALQLTLSSQETDMIRNSQLLLRQVEDYNKRKLEIQNQKAMLENLSEEIESRQADLNALKSYGLLKMIERIPHLVIDEIQQLIAKYWKGKVLSFKLFKEKVRGVETELVRINMRVDDNKRTDYYVDLSLDDGTVWFKGQTSSPTSRKMPELVRFFKEELTQEARLTVESLYKKDHKPGLKNGKGGISF